MAKQYELTQREVDSAYELGTSMVVALLLKVVLDAQANREAAADEIEQGVRQLIAAQQLPDVPAERKAEFRRAAEDRGTLIVNWARNMRRLSGPSQVQ